MHPRLSTAIVALSLLCPAVVVAQPQGPVAPVQAPAAPTAPDEATGRNVAEIDALLGQLQDGTAAQRRAAADAILHAIERDDIPAVRARLLAPFRFDVERVRIKIIRAIRTATGGRENAEYDLLALLLAEPRAPDLDSVIERIVLARSLGAQPSADAGRALVALAASNNGLLRQEVGRIVRGQLHDYVLPALIELRSPSEAMRVFIRQLREALRKVTPGQTVQQQDNALLAEILRAYGSIRQTDAMRVVVSFINSDRVQVRDAARWSVAQYGREAINALREAYEMYEGHDANPAWGYERTARELYAANDRRHDAEVAATLDEGLAAAQARRYDVMLARFRTVLARHPTFERRGVMVAPLMAYARTIEQSDARRAESVYRMALWVDPQGEHAAAVRGAILFLEAERSLAVGVADPELYRAALRVDPSNARAQAQLAQVEQSEVLTARRRRREGGAAALLALALSLLYALVKRPTLARALGV